MFDATSLPIFQLQMEMDYLALDMMLRGIPVNSGVFDELRREVTAAKDARLEVVKRWLPNYDPKKDVSKLPRSTKQMAELFRGLGLKPGKDRKTHHDSYDNEVLFARSKSHPKLKELLWAIMEYRTLGTMQSNVLNAKRDPDGFMRCSFNTASPETFRWSSSKNPWGRGTNLQNVAKPFHNLTGSSLPNLRRAFVPPVGALLWEPDLAGADAQVVAWDSGDELLKEWFRKGVKIHAMRAKEIYGSAAGSDGKAEPYYTLAKKGGHLWHYAGEARTMAGSMGILVIEAERFIKRLEGMHPAVVQWKARIADEIRRTRTVWNAFGYRIIYLGEPKLTEALAWIGQGTIACVANRVALNIKYNVPAAPLILQNHDSLVGYTMVEEWDATAPLIREQFMKVVVPYPEPLIIPPSLKTSRVSWGDMQGESWED